jgi:CDP-glucose 4,6-dehydratase
MAGVVNPGFWAGRRVFLTGHTGFKGAWLCLLLHRLGARVSGYALDPPTSPSLFAAARVAQTLQHDERANILERDRLLASLRAAEADIVLHLAAQPLVRASYDDPVKTFAENVMGTVHVLDAVRQAPSVRAAVIVTTDKCYENREWLWGYRESDRLGGHDPYSSSKAAAELVTQSYRDSFFPPARYGLHRVAVASARAGNVIGGGDWAPDRLVPDAVRAIAAGKSLEIRYPDATRPWQHVLDPLRGYLLLAERLVSDGGAFAEGWNFGPDDANDRSVADLLGALSARWDNRLAWHRAPHTRSHEAGRLKLDCAKARARLGWSPRIDFATAIDLTAIWYDRFATGADMRPLTEQQIDACLDADAALPVRAPAA